MCVQKLLDLGRVDVLPAADDHVLQAAFDAAVTQAVETGGVTVCTEPTGGERCARFMHSHGL